MKKILLLTAVIIALINLLSACSGTAAVEEEDISTRDTRVAETVYGKIKEINGNELLLALGRYPSEEDTMRLPDTSTTLPETDLGENTRSGRTDRGGEMPAGRRPDNAADGAARNTSEPGTSGGGGMQSGGRFGMVQSQTGFALSGDEKTILIPVTASVTTGQGEAAKEIRFTQLGVKNIVRLNLDQDGNIVSVEVLQ